MTVLPSSVLLSPMTTNTERGGIPKFPSGGWLIRLNTRLFPVYASHVCMFNVVSHHADDLRGHSSWVSDKRKGMKKKSRKGPEEAAQCQLMELLAVSSMRACEGILFRKSGRPRRA